ncbi:hypothetical protein KKG52_00715 [Patescibacteria group bacterium]|nr:hypothetical protein [Patescibacteria group bacterium]
MTNINERLKSASEARTTAEADKVRQEQDDATRRRQEEEESKRRIAEETQRKIVAMQEVSKKLFPQVKPLLETVRNYWQGGEIVVGEAGFDRGDGVVRASSNVSLKMHGWDLGRTSDSSDMGNGMDVGNYHSYLIDYYHEIAVFIKSDENNQTLVGVYDCLRTEIEGSHNTKWRRDEIVDLDIKKIEDTIAQLTETRIANKQLPNDYSDIDYSPKPTQVAKKESFIRRIFR